MTLTPLKLEQEHRYRPWLKPRLTRVTASEPLLQQAHSHQGSLPALLLWSPSGIPACSCLCIWAMWSQGHPHEGLPSRPTEKLSLTGALHWPPSRFISPSFSHHHHLHGLRVSSHRRQSPQRPTTWSAPATRGLQPQARHLVSGYRPTLTHQPRSCGSPMGGATLSLSRATFPWGTLSALATRPSYHSPDTGHPVIGPTPSSKKGK